MLYRCALTICFLLASMFSGSAFAAIHVDGAVVSVDLKRASLPAVLKQLAAKSRIDLYLDNQISGKITAHFSHLPLPIALSRLLRHKSYVLSYDSVGDARALWLIRKGSTDYEVIHGYHGADGINTAFTPHSVPLVTSPDVGSSAAISGIADSKVHGAMGAAEVRQQMVNQQQVVENRGWHWVAARQQAASHQSKLRRQLAQAAPEERPAIVQQIIKSQQQEGAVAAAGAVQSVAGKKRLAALTKLKRQVLLPTQQLAQAAQRQQMQVAQARKRQQVLQARLTQQRGARNNFNGKNQSSSSWIVR